MIKCGDKFSAKDLQNSVQEICNCDVLKYIDINQSQIGIVIGDTISYPIQQTPVTYAKRCIDIYKDIPSSAVYLDNQLKQKNYKTAYKFSYNYNLGGLKSSQIIFDTYCLDWFKNIFETAVYNDKYTKEYFDAINKAFQLSYYYAQYLWAQNPKTCYDIRNKLSTPNVSMWNQIICTILGIGFQFHPKDIYEHTINFINPHNNQQQTAALYNEQKQFKDLIMNKYGIDTGCLVLSKANRDRLIKILNRKDYSYYLQVLQNIICRNK